MFDSGYPLPEFRHVNDSESAHANAGARVQRAAAELRMAAAKQSSETRQLGHSGQSQAEFENLNFPEPAVWNGGFLFLLSTMAVRVRRPP